MKVFIGADHGGFLVKEQLKAQLAAQGHEVIDCGADQLDPDDDYPPYGHNVAQAVATNPDSVGLVLCRSGHGMVMVANKVPGVRAALATSPEWTNQSRTHDNANVLGIGADYLSESEITNLVQGWLNAQFESGSHQRRLDQITAIERSN